MSREPLCYTAMAWRETADLIVVGAGAVGGWAAWFAATSSARRVVVLEREARARVAMQRKAGLTVRVVDAATACRLNPTLARRGHRGGSYCATDGAIDPPRNVRAYSLAMQRAGVDLRARTPFLGLRSVASSSRAARRCARWGSWSALASSRGVRAIR